jgi:hypothetical protein
MATLFGLMSCAHEDLLHHLRRRKNGGSSPPTRSFGFGSTGSPPKPKRSNLALGDRAVWGISAKYLGMPAVLATIVLVVLALPLRAEEARVRVPDGCGELADRAGLPLTLTPAEAARAIAYLRATISRDPAVARCRLALRH